MVELTNLGKHRFGDTVTFRCAAGYVLSGSKSVMCVYVPGDNMGSWDYPQPSCIG